MKRTIVLAILLALAAASPGLAATPAPDCSCDKAQVSSRAAQLTAWELGP